MNFTSLTSLRNKCKGYNKTPTTLFVKPICTRKIDADLNQKTHNFWNSRLPFCLFSLTLKIVACCTIHVRRSRKVNSLLPNIVMICYFPLSSVDSNPKTTTHKVQCLTLLQWIFWWNLYMIIFWIFPLRILASKLIIILFPFPLWIQSKLSIPSTLNIDLILWHTQLIVCAVKC